MGFLESILSGLNFIDLAIAVGVCGFTAYSIWHTQQASPPWVWGPILGVGATVGAGLALGHRPGSQSGASIKIRKAARPKRKKAPERKSVPKKTTETKPALKQIITVGDR